jgi:glycosyltransferase involved in cell wall biosynthesis
MQNPAPRTLCAVHKQSDIRFLTVVSTLTRGGIERAAMNYALGYRRAGFPSAVLAYNGGGPRQAALEAEGVEVFVGGNSPDQLDSAVSAARAWSPDILHLNRPGEADERSASILRAMAHPRMRVLETNVFSYADRSADRMWIDVHLHLSRWCLWKWSQSVRGLTPCSPGIVVPYSVDCAAFQPVTSAERIAYRQRHGIPTDAVVFGRVGQASLGKWSPLIVDAFAAVARTVPNAWLAICGLPAALEAPLAALPPEIRARVCRFPITDSDSELRSYYGVMDIFLHAATKGESFGQVLCEAMLSGLPVITLSTPLRDNSQIEVVAHEKTGLVVRDLDQAVDAMLRLSLDSELRSKLASQAPQWVRQTYDIPIITGQLLALVTGLLAAGSAGDLLHTLQNSPAIEMKSSGNLYRELLAGVGIRQSLHERILTSWVNRPSSRAAIRFLRLAQSGLRRVAGRG